MLTLYAANPIYAEVLPRELAGVAQEPPVHLRLIDAARCSSGACRYIPQTVTGAPAAAGGRRKIFSAQGRSGARSNTTRWPASAAQRSM